MGYTDIYIVVGWNFADNCGKVIFLDGRQPYWRKKLIDYYDYNKYGGCGNGTFTYNFILIFVIPILLGSSLLEWRRTMCVNA